MTAECQERLHPIFHNKPYAALAVNDLNDLETCNLTERSLLGRTQDLVGRHSRPASILPRKRAPSLANRGAHPFGRAPRRADGTGSPRENFGKNHLNQKFLCSPKKRFWIEIDARAAAGAAGEQKPVAAGMVAEGVVPCSQRPAHAAQDRFFCRGFGLSGALRRSTCVELGPRLTARGASQGLGEQAEEHACLRLSVELVFGEG